jgi:hypothetical protein
MYKIPAVLFFLLVSIYTKAQDTLLQTYIQHLDSFYRYTPSEKMFLHTDKNWYFPGETIWFKAYATLDNERNTLSKVAYVDLVSTDSKVVQKTKWQITDAQFKGDLFIPEDIKPGNYLVRAYTLYMLNFPEVIDEKIITILNDSLTGIKTKAGNQQPQIYVFPEGGDLVDGVQSKISFKITEPNQLPIQDVSVKLIDEENKILSVEKTMHDGMGFFYFTPVKNKKTKIQFLYRGVEYYKYLPEAKTSGVVLSINNQSQNRLFISLETNDTTRYKSVKLIAQMNGVTVSLQDYHLTEGKQGGAIDKRKLPAGVLTVTIFDNNYNPLCERLVFINNYKQQAPVIETNVKGFGKKERNQITLSSIPDSAHFSIAITAATDTISPFTNHNIITYQLLAGEVKGYVHNPWYYFQSTDSATNEHLDLLMLTNGWRRFKTKDILTGKLPLLNYYVETDLSVTGTVLPDSKNKLANNGTITAIIKAEDSTTIYTKARLTGDGSFFINNLSFRKKAKLFLQGTEDNKRNSYLQIKINPIYIDTLSAIAGDMNLFVLEPNMQQQEVIRKSTERFFYKPRNVRELQEIIIEGRIKSKEQLLTDQYATNQFKTSEYTYAIDSTIAFASIWQYLTGVVPGLTVSGNVLVDPEVNFSRYSGLREYSAADATFIENMNNMKSSIAFYLNEVLVPIESITDMSPKDIALVKVNRTPNIGLGAPNGSMMIYTRKNASYYKGSGFKQMEISGYDVAKEYFSPVYDASIADYPPDFRTTLYWNPNPKVINRKSVISFYNNDISKKIKVVVNGMDKTGAPFFIEQIIE